MLRKKERKWQNIIQDMKDKAINVTYFYALKSLK